MGFISSVVIITFWCQRYQKVQSLLPVRIFLHLLGINYITCPTAYSSNLVITSECFQASLYLTTLNNLVSALNFFLSEVLPSVFTSYNYPEKIWHGKYPNNCQPLDKLKMWFTLTFSGVCFPFRIFNQYH